MSPVSIVHTQPSYTHAVLTLSRMCGGLTLAASLDIHAGRGVLDGCPSPLPSTTSDFPLEPLHHKRCALNSSRHAVYRLLPHVSVFSASHSGSRSRCPWQSQRATGQGRGLWSLQDSVIAS